MPLPTATNPQTNERVVFTGGAWVPISRTATNPETGARAYLVDNQWLTDDAPTQPTATPAPIAPTQPQEVESSIFRELADLPINVARGAVGTTEALTNVFGADNPVSKGLDSVNEFLGRLLSAQAKADQQEISRIMQEAQDAGVLANVKAAAKAFSVAPLDFLAQGVGSVGPAILAAAAGTPGLIGFGVASGTGIIKGAIYDAVRDGLQEQGVSKEEAEQAASQAQGYIGENADMIAVGATLGAVASRFGVEPAFLKGKLGDNLADEIARTAAKEGAEEVVPGVLRRGATKGVQEGATETAQAAQEQLAANLAQRREDLDVPLMRGVVGQGVLEGLVGTGLGAGFGVREAQIADTKLADQKEAARVEAERIAKERAGLGLGGVGPERARWEPIIDAEIASALDAEPDNAAIMFRAGELLNDYGQEAADMYVSALSGIMSGRAPSAAATPTGRPVAPLEEPIAPDLVEKDTVPLLDSFLEYAGQGAPKSDEEVLGEILGAPVEGRAATLSEDEILAKARENINRAKPREAARDQALMEAELEKAKAAEIIKAEQANVPVAAGVEAPAAPKTETDEFIEQLLGESQAEPAADLTGPAPKEGTEAYRSEILPEQTNLFGDAVPETQPVGRPKIARTPEQEQRVGKLTKEAEADRSRRNRLADSVEKTLAPEAAKPFRMPENQYFPTVESLTAFEQEQEQARAAKTAVTPEQEMLSTTAREEQLSQLVASPEYSPFFPSIEAFESFDRKTQEEQNAELLQDIETLGGIETPGAVQQARGKQKAYKSLTEALNKAEEVAPVPAAPVVDKAVQREQNKQQAAVDKATRREQNKKQTAFNKVAKKYADYLRQQKGARVEALKEALLFVQNSKQKNTTAYKKLEGLLASDTVAQDELALATKEIENSRNRGVPVLAETTGKNLVDRKRLSGEIVELTDASAVADILNKNPKNTNFERYLALLLSPLLKKLGVQFKVVATDGVVPESIRDIWVDKNGKALSAGIYTPSDNTIYINFDEGLDASTILHEMLHAVSVGVIDQYFENRAGLPAGVQEAVDTLKEIMGAATEQYLALEKVGRVSDALKAAYISTDSFSDIKEFLSYGNTSTALQTLLLNMPALEGKSTDGKPLVVVGKIKTAFTDLVKAIGALVGFPGRQFSAFEQLVDLTGRIAEQAAKNPPTMTGAAVRARANQRTGAKLAAAALGVRVQRGFYKQIGGLRDFFRSPSSMKEQMGILINDKKFAAQVVIRKQIKKASYNYLVEKLVEAGVPAAARVEKLLRVDVAQYRNKNIRGVGKILDGWEVFARKFPALNQKLEDLLNLTSATNVMLYDPNVKTFVPLKDAIKKDSVLKILDIELQALYRSLAGVTPTPQEQARTTYLENQKAQREKDIVDIHAKKDALNAAPNGAEALAIYKQTVTYYYDIHNERLALLKENILARTASNPALGTTLLNEVVAKFEMERERNSYVPAKRFGPHAVTVYRGPNKTQKEGTYTFETESERRKFIQWHRAKYPNPDAAFERKTFGNNGVDLRTEIEDSSAELRAMITRLDSATIMDKVAIDELKANVYQMYLQTMPESDIRRSFMQRKDTPGFSNDALRVLRTMALANINTMARLKYGLQLKNTLGEVRDSLTGKPDEEQELAEILIDDLAERSLTYMSPPTTEEGAFEAVSRGFTKLSFYWLLTSARTALIQPTQLLGTGFATLHAKYGLSKTMAMQKKYLKNFMTMKALGRDNEINENDPVLARLLGRPVILTSKYVQDSPIRDALEKAYTYGDTSNAFVATHIHDISGRTDDTQKLQESTVSTAVTDFVYGVVAGPMHHLERISREVFFMSAFELEYEKQLKSGLTGDAAITAAAEVARITTNEGMLDYSDINKPPFAKKWYGRNGYQFMTYRSQMLGFIFQNFYRAFAASGLTSAQKREAAIKFYDVQAMAAIMGGVTGVFGYTALVGIVDGLKGVIGGDDEDDPLLDTSFDLYIRESFIPRYFGGDSSIARQMGLDPEFAELLSRGVEFGAPSALTDWNISGSVSLDGLWFQDSPDKDSVEDELYFFIAKTLAGPALSVGVNWMRGFKQAAEGDFLRGLETASPAFIKEPMEAARFAREGSKQPGVEGAVIAPEEYYTRWKLFGQSLGFGSTEVAQEQNRRFALEKEITRVSEEKAAILTNLSEAITERTEAYSKYGAESKQVADAQAKLTEEFEAVAAFSRQYYYRAITPDNINESLTARAERRANTIKGLYVPEWARFIVYPIMMDSPPQPLPEELPRE